MAHSRLLDGIHCLKLGIELIGQECVRCIEGC